ncbi:BMC domain-containing protein [Rubricoccus marinus]|uniref:BMC domain-containing protein n=1 Tax=Rubricoccus marinus TaxID=716817 RepID=UPI002481D0A5|nr:BMC domain-containing protein [Rubricoccus marinus]
MDRSEFSDIGALGMLETHGLVAAIEAADAMLKAAPVRLLQQQRTNPALITHFVVGEVGAVQAAVDAGRMAAERVGRVAAAHVIPRPGEGLLSTIVFPETGKPKTAPSKAPDKASETEGASGPPDAASGADYASMTVRELRSLARDQQDEAMSGREIARATKAELVAYLSEVA